jgi:transposase-like protein
MYSPLMRNVLSAVPSTEMAEVASDLKDVFKVSRESSVRRLAEEFAERYRSRGIASRYRRCAVLYEIPK